MNWLLILTAGFVAANIVWGFFKGLLRVIYSMIAWILVLVVVTSVTPHVTDWMMKNTKITERIESSCKEKIQKIVTGEEETQEEKTEEEKEDHDLQFWDSLLNTQNLADGLLEKSGAYDAMAQEMTAVTVKTLSFILVLVITLFISFFLTKILDLIGKLPVIGEINHALGGVAGFIKGILLVWLIFSFIAMGSATDIGAALYAQIQTSSLLLWFYNNNPVLVILERIIK